MVNKSLLFFLILNRPRLLPEYSKKTQQQQTSFHMNLIISRTRHSLSIYIFK